MDEPQDFTDTETKEKNLTDWFKVFNVDSADESNLKSFRY